MRILKRNILLLLAFMPFFAAIAQSNISVAEKADFKIATWNVEWLSCTDNGPTDENLQINNVVSVIKLLDADIVALQEVGTSSTYATIDTIVKKLGSAWDGRILPSKNTNCGQNQGILFKKSKIQFNSFTLITTGGSSYNWSSGRYPVLYNLNFLVEGTTIPVSLINIHAKAMGDETSYTRRKEASEGLKNLLNSETYSDKKIILMGDFNDYLTGTQCNSCSTSDSPYKNFMQDVNNFVATTGSLIDLYYNKPVIDNILISNELFDNYIKNSAQRETQVASGINNYRNTTSDHTPISIRMTFTTGTTNPDDCKGIDFMETFTENLGEFTTISDTGDQIWNWRQNYGAYMSGYNNNVNNVNEDWIISPAFDLSTSQSAKLSFEHAINFVPSPSIITEQHKLYVSNNYTTGTPSTGTWTPLIIPTMPIGNNWNFVQTGDINIPAQFMKNNFRFAFKYISTNAVAGAWEIKNINLRSQCKPSGYLSAKNELINHISVIGHLVRIEMNKPGDIYIFDVMGRLVYTANNTSVKEITIQHTGIFIVKAGHEAHKIIVK